MKVRKEQTEYSGAIKLFGIIKKLKPMDSLRLTNTLNAVS